MPRREFLSEFREFLAFRCYECKHCRSRHAAVTAVLVIRIYQTAVTFAAEDNILTFCLKFEHLSCDIDAADLCINRSAVYLLCNGFGNEGCAYRRYHDAFSLIFPVLCQIHEHKGEFLVFFDVFAFVVDEDSPVGIAVMSDTEFGSGGDNKLGEGFESFR